MGLARSLRFTGGVALGIAQDRCRKVGRPASFLNQKDEIRLRSDTAATIMLNEAAEGILSK
jgi:hypothetical protein